MTQQQDKEAFFLRFWPSLICILIAFIAIPIAFVLVVCAFIVYHTLKFIFRRKHRRIGVYLHETLKGLDCWLCSVFFGGRHDETISNRAARELRDAEAQGIQAKRYARVVGAFTEYFDPGHMARAIEKLRDEVAV